MKGCPQGIEAARAQMALGRLQELFLAGRLDALGLSATSGFIRCECCAIAFSQRGWLLGPGEGL